MFNDINKKKHKLELLAMPTEIIGRKFPRKPSSTYEIR